MTTTQRVRLTYSASVAQANTPESDSMPQVMHKVWCANADGSGECEVLLMAADPLDALDKVACMDEGQFAQLQRAQAEASTEG